MSRSTSSFHIDLAFFSIQDLTRLQSFDTTVFEPLLIVSHQWNFHLFCCTAALAGCCAHGMFSLSCECTRGVRGRIIVLHLLPQRAQRSISKLYAFVSTHVANRFFIFISICLWIALRMRMNNLFRCLYFIIPRTGLRVSAPKIRYLFLVATISFSARRLSRSRKRLPPPTGNLW